TARPISDCQPVFPSPPIRLRAPFRCRRSPCFFFFSFRRDPLHLHSFPTRRSSDLPGLLKGSALNFRRREPFSRRSSWGPRCGSADRKSTRLNSSHVAISYAVFCLKKKKKTR